MANSILGRVWVAMVVLVLVILVGSGLIMSKMTERTYYDQRAAEMLRQGELLAKTVEADEGEAQLGQKLELVAQLTQISVLVASEEGEVWKSSKPFSVQRRFSRIDQDEIQQMREGKPVIRRGYSRRLDTAVLSVVVPYHKDNRIAGAVILQAPLSGLQAFIVKIRNLMLVEIVGALMLVTLMAFLLARGLVRPILDLVAAAKEVAAGNYSFKVSLDRQDELGVLGNAFNNMAGEVERSIKVQRDFVTNVSHELRTPLSIIKGYAESLQDNLVEQEFDRQKHIQIILDEADRLGRLTSELLDLAQVEAGNLRLNRQKIGLLDFVAEVLSKLACAANGKEIAMENVVSAQIEVDADYDRLFQVLINVVGNAIRFTPPDGSIIVDARNVDDGVSISITDTGVGIAANDLPFIWERFYIADPSRVRSGGRGLGLSISKSIVEAHGGKISAESNHGQGATFIIYLPGVSS